jgi:DNA mismatch repair protein MutL
MSRIRLLSDHLANQIAAGEVVERPASVVKELVENSLDAGAARISIEVAGGGTRLIRVVDNGQGMDGDDVLLCLERHATSKLRDEQDLTSITTLGFRGEAIPSIGSVSRMTILSRPPEAAIGTRAEVRFGVLQGVRESGMARGTVIEVNNLFGNIPARKKFLKSARTELHHIEEVVKNLALAHPGVEFSLQVDGRARFSLPVADFQARMREVFRYKDDLLVVAGHLEEPHSMTVDGLLCLPEAVSAATARLRILVNGRAVQDRMLRHAVMDGLQGFLMKGHGPAGVIRLVLDPAQVDVNVHPAKREIRFRESRRVHDLVRAAARSAVADHQERLRDTLFAASPSAGHGAPLYPRASRPETSGPAGSTPDRPLCQVSVDSFTREPVGPDRPAAGKKGLVARQEDRLPMPMPGRPGEDGQGSFSGLRVIGQLLDLYLLCERDGCLVVIDQHAAHERILFGRLAAAYQDRNVPVQRLLFPVTVELGAEQGELLEQQKEELARMGMTVADFGDNTYVIKGVPAAISQLDPADILADTLAALKAGGGSGSGSVLPAALASLFASLACKAAIKAGNTLRPEEMVALLAQMEASPVFSHCPHGRPVVKTFTRQDIERWFHRT